MEINGDFHKKLTFSSINGSWNPSNEPWPLAEIDIEYSNKYRVTHVVCHSRSE